MTRILITFGALALLLCGCGEGNSYTALLGIKTCRQVWDKQVDAELDQQRAMIGMPMCTGDDIQPAPGYVGLMNASAPGS